MVFCFLENKTYLNLNNITKKKKSNDKEWVKVIKRSLKYHHELVSGYVFIQPFYSADQW